MMIFVYTLTFAIDKNGEGSTASISRAKEVLERWRGLEDSALVPESFLPRYGFGDVKKAKAFFIFV